VPERVQPTMLAPNESPSSPREVEADSPSGPAAGNGVRLRPGDIAVSSVTNGDFESGPTGWVEYSTHGWPLIINSSFPSGVMPHSGTWAVWLGGDYDDTSYIQQQVTVSLQSPYLAYWHWIGSEDTCGNDYGSVIVNSSTVDVYDLCQATGTGDWVKHVVDLSAYMGQSVTLQIQATTNYTLNSNLFVDDVTFQSAITSPSVTSITPNRGSSAGTVHITDLAGENFQAGASVKLAMAGYSDITATSVTVVSTSQITCDFDLTGAAAGQWDVVVTNPDLQSGTLPGGFTVSNTIYLPLAMRRWPPIPDTPVLDPIDNSDGDGYYTVSWNAAYLADTYTLQEDDNAGFSSPTTRYADSGTSWYASDQAVGTYYYRVRASNSWGDSQWSNIQSVTVLPPMSVLSVQNDTGGQLCYEVYGTGIGQRCYSSGTYYYGTFPAGTYSWQASARCGSASGSRYYAPGTYYHRFWCSASASTQSTPSQLESGE
jgi:hypothetical protein